ncbi:MAG: chromosome partitioning protein ParB [Pyrinomonadaceae bacterium]
MSEILSTLGPDGALSVWDVARLRRLSEALPRRWVSLDSLKDLDENLWFNIYGETPTCRAVALHAKRIYEADLEYPVILSPEGEVMDGMHRIAKAWLLGMAKVLAVQFTVLPPPDEVIPDFDLARRPPPARTAPGSAAAEAPAVVES